MKDQDINLAIARICGWEVSECGSQFKRPGQEQWQGRGYSSIWQCIPDYVNDLNAIHSAEQKLTWDQRVEYIDILFTLGFSGDQNPETFWNQCTANARIRAEALLRTIKQWID